MDSFFSENSHYFYEMTEYTGQAEDKEVAAEEIASCFTEKVGAAFISKKKKIPGYVQADLNMFMVYYVFPSILKTEKEDADLIAGKICENWNRFFRNCSISYTDYDTLHNSFRNRFLGFTFNRGKKDSR